MNVTNVCDTSIACVLFEHVLSCISTRLNSILDQIQIHIISLSIKVFKWASDFDIIIWSLFKIKIKIFHRLVIGYMFFLTVPIIIAFKRWIKEIIETRRRIKQREFKFFSLLWWDLIGCLNFFIVKNWVRYKRIFLLDLYFWRYHVDCFLLKFIKFLFEFFINHWGNIFSTLFFLHIFWKKISNRKLFHN